MLKILKMRKESRETQKELISTLNSKANLTGYLMKTIGELVVTTLITICFIFGACLAIYATILVPSLLTIMFSIIIVACSLVGIGEVIIGASDVVFLIQETKQWNNK